MENDKRNELRLILEKNCKALVQTLTLDEQVHFLLPPILFCLDISGWGEVRAVQKDLVGGGQPPRGGGVRGFQYSPGGGPASNVFCHTFFQPGSPQIFEEIPDKEQCFGQFFGAHQLTTLGMHGRAEQEFLVGGGSMYARNVSFGVQAPKENFGKNQ